MYVNVSRILKFTPLSISLSEWIINLCRVSDFVTESSPGVLSQGLGGVHHYRRGCGGSGDLHPAVPAGHGASLEGDSFWR